MTKKLSNKDIEILKAINTLYPEFKYITKDSDDYVWIFKKKPEKYYVEDYPIEMNVGYWIHKDRNAHIELDLVIRIDFVSWADDEPLDIIETLKYIVELREIKNTSYEVVNITRGLSKSSSQFYNYHETAKNNYEIFKKYYQDNKIEAIVLLKENTSYGPYGENYTSEYLESISIK